MISKSMFPGGSPVALASPEQWSLLGFGCRTCKTLMCDRCATCNAGVCTCGQPLYLSIKPVGQVSSVEDAAADAAPMQKPDFERMRAFASVIAAQANCALVEYSTFDFGRQRKPGQLTLLLDRKGQPEGERGMSMVQHLRRLGLPPGVQVFANTLRNLGEDPEHEGRDEVVFVCSFDHLDVIRAAEVDPANHDLTTEAVADQLARWHQRFGVEIVAADTETVVLRFLRLPVDLDTLTAEIVDFCPDLEETFEMDPQALAKSTWIWLWWD
jgi:Domain of unknown function (DUF4253)